MGQVVEGGMQQRLVLRANMQCVQRPPSRLHPSHAEQPFCLGVVHVDAQRGQDKCI